MIRSAARAIAKSIPPIKWAVKSARLQFAKSKMVRKANRALPGMLAVELTNNCNLKCSKCPITKVGRKRGFLDKALFEKILSDVRAAGVPVEIALSGGGEPTLHGDVVEFVRMARAVPNVTRVGFATNAVRLTPGLSRSLLEAGLNRLKLSLDTDDPETYLRLNRVDEYETVVSNILHFTHIKKQGNYKCDVELKITLYTDDLSAASRLRDFWSPHVDRVRATRLHNWAGLKGGRQGNTRSMPCRLLWRQIQILWDGQITLCCQDSMEGFFNMGNAWEIDISHYWRRDPKLLKIRRSHLKGDFSKLPVCAKCAMDQYKNVPIESADEHLTTRREDAVGGVSVIKLAASVGS